MPHLLLVMPGGAISADERSEPLRLSIAFRLTRLLA
jgi:hypothetical protein